MALEGASLALVESVLDAVAVAPLVFEAKFVGIEMIIVATWFASRLRVNRNIPYPGA